MSPAAMWGSPFFLLPTVKLRHYLPCSDMTPKIAQLRNPLGPHSNQSHRRARHLGQAQGATQNCLFHLNETLFVSHAIDSPAH